MSSRPDRRAIAFHEAGHAVLAWQNAKPGSVSAVLISTETGSGGFTFFDLAGAAPWQRYAVKIAGPLAMAVYAECNGLSIAHEPSEDVIQGLAQALEDAGAVGNGDSGLEPVYTPESLVAIESGARRRSIEAQALRLLRQHWPAVEAIAAALEDRGGLSAREVTRIMRRHGVERARA